jgi:hypothetical protein
MVYSGLAMGSYSDMERVHYHSDYRLCSADGKPLQWVRNRVGQLSEDPASVGLPPGRYSVTTRAAGFGTVTVPIVIEPGKTTSVHLDGSEPIGQGTGHGFVSLPDGLIIGWRAKDEANKTTQP